MCILLPFNLEISDFQVFAMFSHTVTSLRLHFLSLSHVPTVCTLACATLLFPDRDIKCYGLNWGTRGMLILILSSSVPSDALKTREDCPGIIAMCHAYIMPDQSSPSALLTNTVFYIKNKSVFFPNFFKIYFTRDKFRYELGVRLGAHCFNCSLNNTVVHFVTTQPQISTDFTGILEGSNGGLLPCQKVDLSLSLKFSVNLFFLKLY